MSVVAGLSGAISKALGDKAITYDTSLIHSTLADLIVHKEGHEGNFVPDQTILDKLARAAEAGKRAIIPPCFSFFGHYLFNTNSVILPPIMNVNYGSFGITEAVHAQAQSEGVNLRKPWGRHLTISRFKSGITTKEVDAFLGLMATNPNYPNVSKNGDHIYPDRIDSGFFELGERGLKLTIANSIRLNSIRL